MFSLSIWQKPNSEEIRIYINGTPRKALYFCAGKDGTLRWSSKTNDTPHKYQTGDHYGKIRKDQAAAEVVAEAYSWTLGQTAFNVALQVARDGIQVEG